MEPPLHKWSPTGFTFFLNKITWLQLDTPQKLRNLDTEVVFQGWGIPMRDDTWTLPGIVQPPKGGWLQRIKTNIEASSVGQTYWAMLRSVEKASWEDRKVHTYTNQTQELSSIHQKIHEKSGLFFTYKYHWRLAGLPLLPVAKLPCRCPRSPRMLSPWMPDLCLATQGTKKTQCRSCGVKTTNLIHLKVMLQKISHTINHHLLQKVGSNHCTFLFLLQPTGSSTTPRQLLLSQGNHMTTLLEEKKTQGTDKKL